MILSPLHHHALPYAYSCVVCACHVTQELLGIFCSAIQQGHAQLVVPVLPSIMALLPDTVQRCLWCSDWLHHLAARGDVVHMCFAWSFF
jgi:hypothetical protein